jgi:uncharacterized protein DUF4956
MVLKQLKFLIYEPRKALFGQLTLYFGVVATILYAVFVFAGDIIGSPSIPVDTAGSFSKADWQTARWEPTAENLVFLLYSLVTVVLLTVPITWVYRGTRRRKDLDQSIVETILILPIIVTGIIMIVQSNLALAFSLAGIFAGVQFRSRLKEIADAHYLFASIGIALAAGVGAWHIAYVLSVFFCFGLYTFWRIGYANESGDRHTRHASVKDDGRNADDPEKNTDA